MAKILPVSNQTGNQLVNQVWKNPRQSARSFREYHIPSMITISRIIGASSMPSRRLGQLLQYSHGQQKYTPNQLKPNDDIDDGETLHCPWGWDRCDKVTEVERTSYPRIAVACQIIVDFQAIYRFDRKMLADCLTEGVFLEKLYCYAIKDSGEVASAHGSDPDLIVNWQYPHRRSHSVGG